MLDTISNWLIRISALGLIAMTAVIFWQVFGRFVLQSSPSWSEQTALLLMIWYVLFAAAAGVREGFHIRIAFLEDISSDSFAKIIRTAIHIIVALFGVILCLYGVELIDLVSIHVIPSLGISRGFAYLPLPFAGFMIALFALTHAYREWASGGVTASAGANETAAANDGGKS